MATPRFLGPYNGFVPEATGQLIAYMRDPKKYALNQYAQYVKTPKTVGLYAKLDPDQPVRIVSQEEWAWADGDPRPAGNTNQLRFEMVEFATQRRDFPYTIGDLAVENCSWEVIAAHANMTQNQCMTARTMRVISLLETAANWGTTNTADANVLNAGAGKWDTGSDDPADANYLAVKKAIDVAIRKVLLLTNGQVERGDLMLIISPGLALRMSESPEIHDYVKQSPFALAQLRGDAPNQNALFGLPEMLYGIRIVVETAVKVTERAKESGVYATTEGVTPTRAFVKSDTSAIMVSRPGGLDGIYGAPSFSSVQIYYYGSEIEVEAFSDPKNRRTEGHVVENVKEVVAAPAAGFLITNVV